MPLAVTTSVKDQIANAIFSAQTYAALGTGYKQTLIDKWTASVLTEIETLAQWMTFNGTATGTAPVEMEPMLIDESIARIERNAHPERYKDARSQADQTRLNVLASFARLAMTYSPGTTTEAFVYTVQNVRNYVLAHCLRMRPMLLPQPETVDAELDGVLRMIWNKAAWPFRRRPCTLVLDRTAFTGGTWTEATKTISGLTGVSTSLPAGTRFFVTAGTGANARDFSIVSTTATTIVLADSIGAASDAKTDIEGFYYTVTFEGLESGESFDSIASFRFYYTDVPYEGSPLAWLTSDDFAKIRAAQGATPGRPFYFRTEMVAPSTMAWFFSPIPDGDYAARGEVYVLAPAAPTSASATATMDKFAREFLPAMRKLVLARVLTAYNRHNQDLTREALDEVESLYPVYIDDGSQDARIGTLDIYGDQGELTNGRMRIGDGI